jgi:hypothetical protein
MNTLLPHRYVDVLGQISLDDLHIQHTFEHYKRQYQQSLLTQEFVANNCLIDPEMKNSHQIGFCDRTLGKHIPKVRTPEGAAIRGSLQRCGLVRASGHELFRGCVVFPTRNESGEVLSAIGYRVGRTRPGDKPIVYWQKPEPKAFIDVGLSFAKVLINEQAYH